MTAALSAVAAACCLLAAAAAAKAPPEGTQLCGADGCSTIGQQAAEQLLVSGGGSSRGPSRPAPFYLLQWAPEGATPGVAGYWVPERGAVKLPTGYGLSWSALDPAAQAVLEQAAAGLQPFAAPAPSRVLVGRLVAANPASYVLLLGAGRRVSTWVGAVDWIPVRLSAAQPSPWTDGSLDLRISKASGFVWRDGAVYKIPLELARRVRLGRSLT